MTSPTTGRTPQPVPADERRAEPRWLAFSKRARLAWGEGRPPFRIVSARLIDISERGARVETDTVHPDIDRVWVRLEANPFEWVRATVKAVRVERGGTYGWCLHLMFPESCPAGVLEEAITPEQPPPPPKRPWSHNDAGTFMPLWFEHN
jgi:hypothetical protein